MDAFVGESVAKAIDTFVGGRVRTVDAFIHTLVVGTGVDTFMVGGPFSEALFVMNGLKSNLEPLVDKTDCVHDGTPLIVDKFVGESVGASVGENEGTSVVVGESDVGSIVGTVVGISLSISVGTLVGAEVVGVMVVGDSVGQGTSFVGQ